ncbi:apolipoprotein D-like [Mizuhopecten yessoensis]|uniref:Apolipoprotein D n=1 Tax=Mizuhopecten yessoensis TaxID=6573 RepID=A0A210QPC4_MIZYE|nr:apolipoprotein D-like [Mizuhopecten yessoensis]OWF50593.1 Apolipoprotein D [Mizuhopecten yessoensis]
MALHLQVLFLLGTASLLHAACPLVPVRADFDPSKFAGKWYQVERLETGWGSTIYDQTTRCFEIKFTEVGNGSFSAVSAWKFQLGRYFLPTSMDSNFNRISTDFPNYFRTGMIPWLPLPSTTFYVLKTDYVRYAIVYSCTDLGIGLYPVEMSWIIHRKKAGFTVRRRKTILEGLPDNGITFIDATKYKRIDFDRCSDDNGQSGNLTTMAT